MSEATLADPILVRLKQELVALYGPRLKQVLLYGSRARGDFHEDSDYDVLVVIEGPLDYWKELHRLADLSSAITWDTVGTGKPVVASFKAATEEMIQKRTGFMHNVRREGIPI
jgi:predicted nucleotidyltransferase